WTNGAETFGVTAPYSGQRLAEVYSADANEGLRAVAAASEAASKMRSLSRFEIAAGLQRISDQIGARREEFAKTIALEAAKPIRLARGEVDRAAATFHWAAGESERFAGEIVPMDVQPNGRGKTAFTLRVPRGVVFGITPFNFPLNLVAHKVAPALASGNAIIIKPSPRTPLTALLLGEAFLESGLPESALQIVPMDVKYLDGILADERIGMLSFTGSAPIGWALKQKAGKKPIALELGGNAPVIVDATADIENSVSRTLVGAFAYTGQVCISVQRIFVHDQLFDNWTNTFVERAKKQKTGDPLAEDTEISAMIDEAAAKRAEQWVAEAVDHGARLMCGGKREGSVLEPTVLTNTDPEMRIVAEEAFAPVAVVERFSEFAESIAAANNSKYGLQAGVFTNDLRNTRYAIENLDFGGVIINDVPTFRVDNMPYGGSKDSGFGREGVRYAMEEMTELRIAVLN
ncbi:MAG TPA: aldehyde dehydrogenase family protein, partial [Pyrinomonadaceae bacterium]|nr:aldehyde dehydrogenase family protein [Pyrinomonadaceae bacterium]